MVWPWLLLRDRIGSRQGKNRSSVPALEIGETFPKIPSPVLSSWSSLSRGREGWGGPITPQPHPDILEGKPKASFGQREALCFLWCGEVAGSAVPSLGDVSFSFRQTAL